MMERKDCLALLDQLAAGKMLTLSQFTFLIDSFDREIADYAFILARKNRELYYGKDIYIRGLIEFTNYCRNDCYYCGLRRSNARVKRYRLGEEEILSCCRRGYDLGFRTFVLQGGEDPGFKEEALCEVIQKIKGEFPECAITLSVGEREEDVYRAYFEAGADRYLLRHETADECHYNKLHPEELRLENRKKCLSDLKKTGFQIGAGFMVGSPYQTAENLAKDLLYLYELQPQMVGIGPFIPQKDTPFADKPQGTLLLTCFMLSLLRLILPKILLPSTTALATIHPDGRKMGILAGANVIMPNLSPQGVRDKYLIYDNKLNTGIEGAEGMDLLKEEMDSIGYRIVTSRGDSKQEGYILKGDSNV